MGLPVDAAALELGNALNPAPQPLIHQESKVKIVFFFLIHHFCESEEFNSRRKTQRPEIDEEEREFASLSSVS